MEAPEYFHTVSYHHQQHQNQMMMISPEKKYCSEVKNGGGGGGDFFPIEDLLDFSNEEFYGGGGGVENGGGSGGNSTDSSTITTVGETAGSSSNSSFSGEGGRSGSSLVDPNFPEDLCVPYEDLAELEWLSNFVDEDDSFSSEDFQKLQIISGVKARDDHHPSANGTPDYKFENNSGNGALTARSGANSSFKTESPVPARARSKRSRAAACNWSSRLIVLSPTSSSSECEVFVEGGEKQAPLSPSPVKLGKKRELSEHPEGRKCLHCATDKTPQWRTGPLGPKTLCNACGVRYKSGRLVPEYRPAASPTFVLTKHSNSHRKVLELRRQKDLHTAQRQFFQQAGVFDVSAGKDNADDYLIHTGPDYRQLI